jgi:hypothetical protein
MNHFRQYYFSVPLLVWPILLLQNLGCQKDYSYEGGDSASIVKDSITSSVAKEFPDCSLCQVTDDITIGRWNFKKGNSFLCGTVDNSGFVGTNKTFTFFGPSACSTDTGLVMTVYLPIAFDQDQYNITTTQAAFYYYDDHAAKDIFISLPTAPFSVTVESFIYSTGIATGTFKGTVFKANGDTTFIKEGKFKVKIR